MRLSESKEGASLLKSFSQCKCISAFKVVRNSFIFSITTELYESLTHL